MQSDLERDDLVMSLVESALEQPAESLEVFFSQVSQTHPGVIEEVRERVEWELRMGQFLRDPVVKRAAPQPPPFEVGDVVNRRFEILRVVGEGGMGYVYEAQDTRLDRRVAIKCARGGFAGRLTPEARSALEVSHVNVCKMHELHTAETAQGPVDFLTMEFVDGETLYARIAREGPLQAAEAHEVARQICAGLEQAHKQGVVHGDLKTGNILLARSGDERVRAVITDFGLARFQSGSSTDAAGGTPDYMAPELMSGSAATVASDIYALGVLFSVMLTGAPAKPGAVPKLPRRWGRVVSRCLAADPRKRYESAGKVARDLSPARSVVTWVVAAAAIVLAVFSAYLWQNQAAPETPVRLVALPAVVEGGPLPGAAAVGGEVAERLSGVRRNFTVIAPAEAARQKVDSVEGAREKLAATHVLTLRLRSGEGKMRASASVVDASTGVAIRKVDGEYGIGDTAVLARALLGTVTSAFRLKKGLVPDSVSENAYAAYAQGVALLRRDNSSADQAIPFLNKAADKDPASPLPKAALAEAYLQKYRNSGSTTWLELSANLAGSAQSLNPDSLPVLLMSGRVRDARGHYELALQDYSRVIELNPMEADGWRRLALMLDKTGRDSEANAAFKRAIEISPGSFRAYLDYGNHYHARGDNSQAERLYRRATELAPGVALGHVNLGVALLHQNRYDEAKRALLRAVELEADWRTFVNLGCVYAWQGRFKQALPWFERAVADGPPSSLSYRHLADTLRHVGRRKESLAAYSRALILAETNLATDPRQASIRALVGLLSAHLGQRSRAESETVQALASGPNINDVLRDAILAYHTLGKDDRAIEVLRKAPPHLIDELGRSPDMSKLAATPNFQKLLVLAKDNQAR